jgi:hypothetical protein
VDDFSTKERLRFRKLLEVAHSSTFAGERDAALAAATRLAAAHGMSLREAAGMAEHEEPPAPRRRPQRRTAGFNPDVAAAMRAAGINRDPRQRSYARFGERGSAALEEARLAAEKRRYDAAMAEAVQRGLDAEERAAAAKAAAKKRDYVKRPNRQAFRNRAEFIRVLLKETSMSAREIATTVGVPIYDVFREKLLMRKRAADTAAGA